MSAIQGPAILITIGTLFLLGNYTHYNIFVPMLLIVLGLVQLVKRSASAAGHVEPGYEAYYQQAGGYPYGQAPYGQPSYGQTQPYPPYPYAQTNASAPQAAETSHIPTAPVAPATVTPPPAEYPSLPSGDKEKE